MNIHPRCLHILGGRQLGGAERFFLRLVQALARRGVPITAGVVRGGEVDDFLPAQIPRLYLPMAGIWDLYSFLRIRLAARNHDVVQTYMGRATRLTRLPQGQRPVHVARLGGYYGVKGYRHAHAWVGNTRGIRDYLIRAGLPAERVFYIGNFVDPAAPQPPATLAALRQRWSIPQQARVLLGLGRLHPNKGFADLLMAFARLPVQVAGRPLWLVMVGDGPLRDELRNLAGQLGISDRMTWAGWQHDPSPWYQMAEVFVCPSRHEPLGNVILEAWANGVPSLSTATQGPTELIQPGVEGMLTPVADPPALAETIRQMLEMGQAQRQAILEAGRRKLQKEYSEEAIVSAYLDLYRRLLA